jgi:hypothetical protein
MLADLPDGRQWPTPETEIKNAQLVDLERRGLGIDVVFIGSSVTEAGIDPVRFDRLTGLTSYNAALPFSSPLSNEIWLREYVLPRVNPKAVVVGLGVWPNESTLTDDMLLSGLTALDSDTGIRTGLALFDRRSQLRSWSDTQARARQVTAGAITPQGHQTIYYERTRRTQDSGFIDSETARMSEDNRDALWRTVAMLQDRSIEVIMLIEPIGCPPILGTCARFDLETHPGRELARDFGLRLIDSASRAWPLEVYADTAHFNETGVEALTTFVSERFVESSD